MVMHARKQARVNDGYTERKDPHLHQRVDRHQNMQRGNVGMYGDRSPAEGSVGRNNRTDSPRSQSSPRYHNKMSYLERHKDKRGSLHLAEEKVSQYLATGSIGEKAPHTYEDYQDHRHDSAYEGKHGHDMSGSSSRKETKEERDHRTEVQKSAVRVCGDWSEHISSSGKRYYYNYLTEVSQWEKPKEWNSSARRPERSKDRGNTRSSTSGMQGDERPRHSSTNELHCDGRNRPLHMDSSSATQDKITHRPSTERHSTDTSCSTSRVPISQESGSRRNSYAEASHSHNHKGYVGQGHPGHNSHPDLKRNSVHVYSSGEPSRHRPRRDSDNGWNSSHRSEDGLHQDTDMSPDSTPTNAPSSCTAIQTLQELQKALSLHIKKQQSKGGQSAASSSTGTTSAQLQSQLVSLQQDIIQQHQQNTPVDLADASPQNTHPSVHPSTVSGEEGGLREQHPNNGNNNNTSELDGQDSPATEISPGSSCRSPTPSRSGSPSMPTIGTSALSAAALKSQQSVGLSPSLSNYYNEKLIGHVIGWNGEQFEKQAERFRQEALLVGSLHCSHVCVELKRARSNVRTAEIQSTIQEQRVMMIRQHRAEIESLKLPTSLLPS